MTVKNATLTYRGSEVKLGELFADNSTFYDSLLSDHIENALKGDKFKLTKAVKSFYDGFMLLTWSNMTQTLRDKFLTSKVNFQGEFVELGQILSHHDALNSLNTSTIRDIFDLKFKISSPVEIKSKFFIERSFVDEELELESRCAYEDEVNVSESEVKTSLKIFEEVQSKRTFLLSDKSGEGKSTTFRNFGLKLKQQYPGKWVQFLDLKKYDKAFEQAKKLTFDDLHDLKEFFSSKLLNLNDFESQIFLDLFESSNVYFLYDGVDEISPNYNDLILNLMEKVKNFTENLQFVSTRPQHSVAIQERLQVKAHKFLPLNETERWNLFVKFVMISNPQFEGSCEIEFFNKSQATKCSHSLQIQKIVERSKKILNSIEILPGDEFCNSTKALDINRKIENILSNPDLEDEASIKEALRKLGVENQESFVNFLHCHISYSKSINLVKKIIVDEFPISFDFKFNRFVVNPLLIEMIGEFVSDSEVDFDFYSVYEDFIMKKIKIVRDKGEIARSELDNITYYALNVRQAHQAYAIKLFDKNFRSVYDDLSKDFLSDLTIMKSMSEFSNDEISRFGLLHVTSEDDFEFAHLTFAEFLVAQYIIESLNNFENLNNDERSSIVSLLKLNLMEVNLFGEIFGVINQFIMSYSEQNAEQSDLWKRIKEIRLKIKQLKSVTENLMLWGLFIEAEFSFLLKAQNDDIDIKLIRNDLIEELTEKFDKIKEIFRPKTFNQALTSTDMIGSTLLHVTSLLDSFEDFLIKLNETLSQSEWKSLIFAADKYGVTAFDLALNHQKPQVMDLLKQIIRENLNPSDQEELAKISNFKITN